MGANLSSAMPRSGGAAGGHEQLEGLPGVVYKDSLGGGRLLKTLLAIHDELGPVCVKVYQRRPGEGGGGADRAGSAGGLAGAEDAAAPLESHAVSLQRTAQQLSAARPPHVLPFVHWEAGLGAAYLLRPHIGASLYERLRARPFPSDTDKRVIAWQVCVCVCVL